jgi:hypothetical protein
MDWILANHSFSVQPADSLELLHRSVARARGATHHDTRGRRLRLRSASAVVPRSRHAPNIRPSSPRRMPCQRTRHRHIREEGPRYWPPRMDAPATSAGGCVRRRDGRPVPPAGGGVRDDPDVRRAQRASRARTSAPANRRLCAAASGFRGAEHQLGVEANHRLIRTGPRHLSAFSTSVSHAARSAGVWPSRRRRRMTRSMTTSAPATRDIAPDGNCAAPTWSP